MLSTRPAARPISCTASNVKSVSIFDAFFGHAIHRPSASASVRCSCRNLRARSARLVVKKTTTRTPGFAPSFRASGVAE